MTHLFIYNISARPTRRATADRLDRHAVDIGT